MKRSPSSEGPSTAKEKEHELGDLLFTIVNLTRWTGAHAEDVLRQANQRFSRRYLSMESLAEERGRDFNGLTLNQKEDSGEKPRKLSVSGFGEKRYKFGG
ncbi:MAG: hypothetical protein CM1200mP22_33740 [Dehalococcoidia bacterium]|nr:MAG: hypothetical protein CM1200mP22_33740 [Dehalococcoidia bacterium]